MVESLTLALNNAENSVRWYVTNTLDKISSDKAFKLLILALKDTDISVCLKAAEALGKIAKADRNLPALTQQLPRLLTLIPTEASQQALSVITAIQARCKYYNYDIAQTPLQETENYANPLENTLNELTKAIKNMPDAPAPKYDLRGAKIDKLIDTIGVYNENNFAPEQNLAEAAREIQELLNQLAKINPSEATIADTIQQEIKRNPTLKARLVNALKTGGIEALKAIFNNPFVSIPVETVKGFLEAEE